MKPLEALYDPKASKQAKIQALQLLYQASVGLQAIVVLLIWVILGIISQPTILPDWVGTAFFITGVLETWMIRAVLRPDRTETTDSAIRKTLLLATAVFGNLILMAALDRLIGFSPWVLALLLSSAWSFLLGRNFIQRLM